MSRDVQRSVGTAPISSLRLCRRLESPIIANKSSLLLNIIANNSSLLLYIIANNSSLLLYIIANNSSLLLLPPKSLNNERTP